MVVKRKKTKRRKSSAKKSASQRCFRGRRARSPVFCAPSAKGSGSLKPQRKKRAKAAKVGGAATAADDEDATLGALQLPEGEFRDIGEVMFGRRDAETAASDSPLEFGAASSAQRVRIAATEIRKTPWRKICDLLITAGDGTRHTGTAWFITPRTLVTAGHCISVFKPGSPIHGMVRSILVMPARNGETNSAQSLFGWVEVPRENLRVHPRWANNGDMNFDYGAIILPSTAPPLGAMTGQFGYGPFLDEALRNSAPTLSGYPDNVPDGTQWFEVNLIKELSATRVSYDIFTFFGQSGSPVFFRNNNQDIACAIHTFGDIPLNSGVRINPEVKAQLDAWKV